MCLLLSFVMLSLLFLGFPLRVLVFGLPCTFHPPINLDLGISIWAHILPATNLPSSSNIKLWGVWHKKKMKIRCTYTCNRPGHCFDPMEIHVKQKPGQVGLLGDAIIYKNLM